MNEEYDELYQMLTTDSEEIKSIRENFKDDITYYLNKIKNYQINEIDIANEYDLDTDFAKYKANDIDIKYKLEDECLEYKLTLLMKYLDDLRKERRFLEFRRNKEDLLSKQEYQEYLRNEIYRKDILTKWYKEFCENE